MSTIGTHSGNFHCDEALACWQLRILDQFKNSTIVRTRDPKILDGCNIVVDVGGVYDHTHKKYDHHQRGFSVTMKEIYPNKAFTIKMSSAGLVYAHYGHEVISKILNVDLEDPRVDIIFDKVYETFIQEVDAIDNGISICNGREAAYEIHSNISSRIKHFNPSWNEESDDEILNSKFDEASEYVGNEFKERVLYYGNIWWPAKQIVLEVIKKRFEVNETGEIINLSLSGISGVPWKEHLFTIEKELNIENEIKFVLYSDGKAWRVQAVPETPHSFKSRVSIHPEWLGLRDDELSTKSGIDNCIFVHSSGFIGGNHSFEGAMSMAKKSLAV